MIHRVLGLRKISALPVPWRLNVCVDGWNALISLIYQRW